MKRMVLNAAQREVLGVMACMQSDEDLAALKSTLLQFLNDRLQNELDHLWEEGVINEKKVEEWKTAHYRTPYNNSIPCCECY